MTRLPIVAAAFVTLLTLVTLSVTSASSKNPQSQTAPANTALPSVSGTPVVGNTLQASSGSWQGRGTSYSYQWQRCASAGSCAAVAGATGSSYPLGSADAGNTMKVSVTAKNRYGSTTATSAPTPVVTSTASSPPPPPPPPPSPPPGGNVYFDGRASQMTQLYSYETTPGNISTLQHGQSPNVWSCLCFLKNDISLVSDSTYGQAYKVAVATGDTNPWGGSSTSDGAAQVSNERNNDLGQWDWYAFAVKVPSWNGPLSDLFFSELLSVGYQTSESSQVALGLARDSNGQLAFDMFQNSGYVNAPTSWQPAAVSYTQTFMPVVFGQWEEFVIGVKWATDNTGAVRVYNRVPGGSWSQVFDRENEPTELYGTTQTGTFAADGSNWPNVIDKIGLYYQEYGGESEAVQESGLTRSSDLATAQSTLP